MTPSSMISGIEPRGYAMTGVPAAIASTTDSPNGSANSIGCSRASAPPSRADRSRRPDRSEVAHPVAVDPRRDHVVEVALVLDGPGDQQRPPGALGDVDRVGGALVGMDPAEDDQLVTAGRGERRCRRGRCRGGPWRSSPGRVTGRRRRWTRRPNRARWYAGRIRRSENPWMVVTSGARQCAENASGSQSRWLCTRSNSAERLSAWATCSASHTRPSSWVLGVRGGRHAVQGGRGHRVEGREQGDVDPSRTSPSASRLVTCSQGP